VLSLGGTRTRSAPRHTRLRPAARPIRHVQGGPRELTPLVRRLGCLRRGGHLTGFRLLVEAAWHHRNATSSPSCCGPRRLRRVRSGARRGLAHRRIPHPHASPVAQFRHTVVRGRRRRTHDPRVEYAWTTTCCPQSPADATTRYDGSPRLATPVPSRSQSLSTPPPCARVVRGSHHASARPGAPAGAACLGATC